MIRAFALAIALALPIGALAVELDGAITQGGLIRGTAQPGSSVTLDGKAIAVTPDGRFVFGLGRDAPAETRLVVTGSDGRADTRVLAVIPRKWDIQRVDGLPEKTVKPDPETAEKIKADRALILAARKVESPETGFAERFEWPAIGRISGVFGSQRVLNGEPRAPHIGIDIAAPEGTELRAPASGIVTLVGPGMVLTGNTVTIDHGYGVSSVFAHLLDVTVQPGATVTRGQVIGRIGMTGRATGPHVHWGMFWFDTGVDPALILPPMPEG